MVSADFTCRTLLETTLLLLEPSMSNDLHIAHFGQLGTGSGSGGSGTAATTAPAVDLSPPLAGLPASTNVQQAITELLALHEKTLRIAQREHTSVAHGFAVSAADIPKLVRVDKTTKNIVASIANDADQLMQAWLVDTVDADTVVLQFHDAVTATGHGFTVGSHLFLSASDAGDFVEDAPTVCNAYVQPVGYVLDVDTLIIQPYIATPVPESGALVGAAVVGSTVVGGSASCDPASPVVGTGVVGSAVVP